MILIGQFDSPFVRRVGIALHLYGMAFEHRPWSVFGDAAAIAAISPATRVPVLVTDDGTALCDSAAILDYLDGLAGPGRALFPQAEPFRHRALRIAAMATALSDKAVSLFYERHLHAAPSPVWSARCAGQIAGLLAALEAERAAIPGPWWAGTAPGHQDIAVACTLRHLAEAMPDMADLAALPALSAHAAAAEALPAFRAIRQPFIAPV
jgi:glutathione S-transferase